MKIQNKKNKELLEIRSLCDVCCKTITSCDATKIEFDICYTDRIVECDAYCPKITPKVNTIVYILHSNSGSVVAVYSGVPSRIQCDKDYSDYLNQKYDPSVNISDINCCLEKWIVDAGFQKHDNQIIPRPNKIKKHGSNNKPRL